MTKLLMVILLLEPTDATPIRVGRQPTILGYLANGILRIFLSSVFRERFFFEIVYASRTLQLAQWVIWPNADGE